MINSACIRQVRLRFWIVAALSLSLLLIPRTAHAAGPTMQPMGMHFTALVLHGPDAGVQIDGYLSLTQGSGTQVSGTLSTFAGTLMNRLGSYSPISVTGSMNQAGVTLNLDLSSLTSADMAIPVLAKLVRPQFAHLGAHAMLQATGRSFTGSSFAGSFNGPTMADSGSWTAVSAVGHTFDFSAAAKAGPAWAISGQAAVVIGVDGTVSGLYISDDHKQVYAVRGIAAGGWMSLVLTLGNGQFLYGSGMADRIDSYQFFSGTFYGPAATTSGKWSAAFTS